MKKDKIDLLREDTIVEVVRISSDGSVIKKDMTYGEWKNFKKQKGFQYICYQKGFSQFKIS